METSQKFSDIVKKHQRSLTITSLLSVAFVIAMYSINISMESLVIGIMPLVFNIVFILFHEAYYSLLIPLVLCITIISFIVLQSISTRIQKSGHYVSLILLVFASLITIFTGIASISYITKSYYYPSPQGEKGVQGLQGPRGNKSRVLYDDASILHHQLLIHVQEDYRQLLKQNNPTRLFDDNKDYIENIHFLEKIDSLFSTPKGKQFLQKQKSQMKTCCDEQEYLQKVISLVRVHIKEWLTIFLSYENGRSYLESPNYVPSKWNVFVTQNDKTSGKLSPIKDIETLKENTLWNW